MKYEATPQVTKDLGEDGINEFIDFFFSRVPEEEVEFVPEEFLLNDSYKDDAKPMYSASDKQGRILLVFPMRNGEEKYLRLMYETECPHLDGLHKYGGECPSQKM